MCKQELNESAKAKLLGLQTFLLDTVLASESDTFNTRHHYCELEDERGEVCGTSACMLGWLAMYLGHTVGYEGVDLESGETQDWYSFMHDFVDIDDEQARDAVCDWLFSHDWHYRDNNVNSAVERISYLLTHGTPPIKSAFSISDKALDNLSKLSDYLKALAVSENTKVQTEFDIADYFDDGFFRDTQECGASACAVGHFAIMIGLDVCNEGVKMPNEEVVPWSEVSEQFLDLGGYASDGEERTVWQWFFDCKWQDVDNTPLGVVARINYFLEKGLPNCFVSDTGISKYGESTLQEYIGYRDALERELNLA